MKRAAAIFTLLFSTFAFAWQSAPASRRLIALTADKDSRFRQDGKVAPTIEVNAGEQLLLRVTAIKAKQMDREGSVHGLALLDANLDAVPGWRLSFHSGTQDYELTAPAKPGRYSAVCTVICSDSHEDMGFTLVVKEASGSLSTSH